MILDFIYNLSNKIKIIFLLGGLSFLQNAAALQLEVGANYHPKNTWHPFYSLTVFPWGFPTEEKDTWRGLAGEITYEEKRVYSSILFGSADLSTNPMQSIYIGAKLEMTKFESAGILLKGTTYYLPWFPASLSIDPKYHFKNKDFIWDFKASVGLGRHLSWN